jgi:hypothetical protein
VITDRQSPANTFLLNAMEEVRDHDGLGMRIGDDDGLCESGESCIFAPHVGAYQGRGALTAPCLFSSGNGVDDVLLRAYSE